MNESHKEAKTIKGASQPDKLKASPPVARIPIGAVLKMLGGEFHVTNAEAKSLTLRGPLKRLKRGMILNLFGVAAQVTLVGHAVARLQARGDGMFDTRPILRIADDAPPQQPGKKNLLNAKEHAIAMEFDERLAAFQERVQRNATDEERTAILQNILNPENDPDA